MLNVALIVDENAVAKWQEDALDAARDLICIKAVVSCRNTKSKRSYIKHGFYYVLNFLTLRNHLTTKVPLSLEGAKSIEFDSVNEGAWQRIPSSVLEELEPLEIDVIIKFGMSLLRIDDSLSDYKVFSYHHGDPRSYRGRPAGFYELLHRSSSVGTVVQELSNKLDAGRIWAICHSKAFHHSYKRTALNFYANSRFLLRKALLNYGNNAPVDTPSDGVNYRLPGNFLVLKFLALLWSRKIMRMVYGAFFEKKWNVVTIKDVSIANGAELHLRNGRIPKVDDGYSFYADPIFSADGKLVRLEALNSLSGLGEILEVSSDTLTTKNVLLKGKHFSYPYSFVYRDEEYVLPEVASHSPPYVLRRPFIPENRRFLKGLESYRIVDGTLLEVNGTLFLFCGVGASAADCLYLFYSSGIDEEFRPHPLNPVVIDPARARMGGRIISKDGKLFRFGQNNSFGYGDGLLVCEIVNLTVSDYEEKVVGTVQFGDASGPHTVDVFGETSVFDFYVDKFSLFAWYRRIVPVLLRKVLK